MVSLDPTHKCTLIRLASIYSLVDSDVRANCAKWAILEQLKNPPPAFADVVREHFRLKRDQVKQQLDEWLKLDKSIKDSVKNIKVELDKL